MKTENINKAFDKLAIKMEFWLSKAIEMIPNFVVALLVVLLFNLIARLISKLGYKVLFRVSNNEVISKLIVRFTSILTIATGVFVALGVMHLDKTVTSLLAGVGIVGLALSFAFQHTAADVLSGVIIVMRSTVAAGDLVESNGVFGNVVRIGLRSVRILNVKGQHEEIPNRLFLDNTFKEYSQTGFRRIDLTGEINTSENLTNLKTLVEEEMSKFDFVYEHKLPNMVYNEFKNEKVSYNVRIWMNFTNNDGEFLNSRSRCLVKLNEIFAEQGVEIPRKEFVHINK